MRKDGSAFPVAVSPLEAAIGGERILLSSIHGILTWFNRAVGLFRLAFAAKLALDTLLYRIDVAPLVW